MSGPAGFEIDTDLVERAARQVDATRARLVDATAALRAGVDGDGNPWGDDEQGSVFARVYRDVYAHALEVMDSHADQLGYAARSLQLSAEDHAENDENVRALFESLGSPL